MSNKVNGSIVNRRDFDLGRDTLLVNVHFHKWGGETSSEKVRDAAAEKENADRDSIRGKIVVLPAKAQRRVNSVQDAMVSLWKSKTRLWAEGGWRLIMATDYPSLRDELNELARKYHDAVQEEIVARYDALKKDAEERLNGLIEGRFPSKEELSAKYGVEIRIDQIKNAQDFRLPGLSKAEVDELIAEREKIVAELIKESNKDLINGIAATVKALVDRLTKKDMRIVKGKHTDSYPIFDNIGLQLDAAEKLNFAGDPKIADAIAKVRKELTGLNIEHIKASDKEQKKVVKTARAVLDELANF